MKSDNLKLVTTNKVKRTIGSFSELSATLGEDEKSSHNIGPFNVCNFNI